ncbi:DUF3108 domain-containing protein [Arenimonas composti]|uniref:DUF3108 domain-containing protein n=1 Tax=Arenimonas composti TR7-09 = DSM 18010 TaxID=1121013 RepID=A0A091BI86_9GAMM|nr:DUF3108 domain-containing protein [Arenimonas composti]KFN51456.1 hypothetical protein P873_02680 [Arenimonas composti TR7-09 = DSM 18010]
MNLLRSTVLAAAFVLPAASALAAPPPAGFSAEYEVFQNDKKLGVGTITLRVLADGRYELVTHTEATQGMYGAAGIRRDERSVIDWRGAQPAGVSYRMEQRAAFSRRTHEIDIDAAARTAVSRYRDDTYRLQWSPALIDKHGLTAVMMSELAAGWRGERTFSVAERRDVDAQVYRTAAAVRLRTAIGTERAIRVERVRGDGSGRVTKIWFARERGWLPLRIKQYEGDGDTLDLRIVRVL